MYCMGQTKSQVRHFVRIFIEIKNTVNSCCTISILKNPQQFAWGWEIRHQTSKNRRILHESACMLAGGCTPKWAQFRRPSGLAVPTVLLSEKYSCTDRSSTIARHFPYGTSVCSSLTSENFGQNRYRKSGVCYLVCPIQYSIRHSIQERSCQQKPCLYSKCASGMGHAEISSRETHRGKHRAARELSGEPSLDLRGHS